MLIRSSLASTIAALLLAGCAPAAQPVAPDGLALFTSLPLVWRESETLAGALDPQAEPHWAIAVLGEARALDTLEGLDANVGLLVMAQPRPLSPAENVALDAWVRGGGRVLLFADPLLTAHSDFALGDRRRPEGTVLLSPILTRWGLDLVWDEDQPEGLRPVSLFGTALPVDQAGRFVATGGDCTLLAGGIAARCAVGAGHVLAVADAALLDEGTGQDRAARKSALQRLVEQAKIPA